MILVENKLILGLRVSYSLKLTSFELIGQWIFFFLSFFGDSFWNSKFNVSEVVIKNSLKLERIITNQEEIYKRFRPVLKMYRFPLTILGGPMHEFARLVSLLANDPMTSIVQIRLLSGRSQLINCSYFLIRSIYNKVCILRCKY